MKKKLYAVPQVRFLTVRLQSLICNSPAETMSTSEEVINTDDGDEYAQAKRGSFSVWDDAEE